MKIRPADITNESATNGWVLTLVSGVPTWQAAAGGGGSGTVTTVSVVSTNGVSGTVTNPTTTPAISLSLGAITPTSVAATGTVTGSNLSGTNTGDQTTVSGNAGSATVLQTARTINGVSFDGSANINVNTNNSVTWDNSGTGAASGATFNGSVAKTISYNTIGAQASSAQLTALAGAAWSAGTQVVTLSAANTVTLKTVGSATGNILDKAAGDALYAPIAGGGYQASNARLTNIAAASPTGTQLAAYGASNAITLYTIGAATGNILDKASGDSLYQPLDSDLTSIAALTTTSYGRGLLTTADAAALTAASNAVVGDSGSGGTKGMVPAPASGDAAAGKFLKADGTWAAVSGGGGMTVTVNTYTTAGAFTWTKPTGAKIVEVICIGGGGAGGYAATGGLGGQGGGGGGWSRALLDATTLGSTVTGSVGAAGAVTDVNTQGGSGGTSYFGNATTPNCAAGGGGGGGIGNGTGGHGSYTGKGGVGLSIGGDGGVCIAGGTLYPGEIIYGRRGQGFAGSGGGSGGYFNSGGGSYIPGGAGGGYPTAVSGTAEIIYYNSASTTSVTGYGGGGAAGVSGAAGGAGSGFSAGDCRGGQGGGGGGASSGTAGSGGAGAFPGGGGGGGGTKSSGFAAGGAGGGGTVIVITYA